MSNHLSKSLFSIPRLKKSRSRQQNQPENPTSLCLNALTADDAFLRFAAALGEPFFSSRNPERNFIIFLCIPLPPRLFHPQKAPKRILFLTLHSPSAAPFSPLKNPKGNFIFNTAYPPHARLFFSPRSPERNFILSLYMHPPLRRGPRLPRCITIFSVLSAAFHHAEHRVSLHAEYIQRSCPKCVAPRRNGEIFPPANATAATNRGAGTAIQNEYKKKLYPSARREAGDYQRGKWQQEIYYTGIIGRERSSRSIIHGFSASEGVAGI